MSSVSSVVDQDGVALVAALIALVLASAIGIALVFGSTTETRIAMNFRNAQQALYAADAAAERALDDLPGVADWNRLLDGTALSAFVDGGPGGLRQLEDGASIDLAVIRNLANCQKPAGCTAADMDLTTADRPWGANNPRWNLFAYGNLSAMMPATIVSPCYVVVMVGDDPAETDDDPARDAAPGGPGAGVVALRAEAFGPGNTHKVIELTATRVPGPQPGESLVRVLTWREIR